MPPRLNHPFELLKKNIRRCIIIQMRPQLLVLSFLSPNHMNRVKIPVQPSTNLSYNIHQPLGFPQSMPRPLNILSSLTFTNPIPIILRLGCIKLPPYNRTLVFLKLHRSHLVSDNFSNRNFLLLHMSFIPLLPISHELTLLHNGSCLLQMLEIEIVPKILPFLILITRVISCCEANTQIHNKSPIQKHGFPQPTQETPHIMIHPLAIIPTTRVIQILPIPKVTLRSQSGNRVIDLIVPGGNPRRRHRLAPASTGHVPASIDAGVPPAGVHHLVAAIIGDGDLEAAKVAVLAPGALALVPEAPGDVALAGGGALDRRLVVEEGDGLESAEVEALNGNEDARVGAV
ncbi:hypothetical protein Fmac_004600 [Flemingia macrophylla]|uniref:Uncharacterized protein n=1 Tax=Flemingia macrophylla TaxID=520843 RepID=A0ABD1N5I1_9FABA